MQKQSAHGPIIELVDDLGGVKSCEAAISNFPHFGAAYKYLDERVETLSAINSNRLARSRLVFGQPPIWGKMKVHLIYLMVSFALRKRWVQSFYGFFRGGRRLAQVA
jgi:hypothetical protein